MTAQDVDTGVPVVGWHPAVDEFDERFVVFATSSPTVRFTEPFAAFVAEAAVRGVRPVLVTTTTARVSPFVSLVMRDAGGLWAVQARDGAMFDALSGYQVDGLGGLWAAGSVRPGETADGDQDRTRLPGFTDLSSAGCQVMTFDVHTHQRAESSSRVGVVAETIAAQTEVQWQAWSAREPLLEPWDVGAVTAEARRRMPESHTLRVVGTAGAFCQVQAARTRTGLLEHTVGGVPVPDGSDAVDRATAMVQVLAETHSPVAAFASLAEYDTDGESLGQSVRARAVEAPVVALIGPRAVRELGTDVEVLTRDHDVRTVGRARTPCLLVRFTGDVAQRWAAVVRFGGQLGGESVRRALGGPI